MAQMREIVELATPVQASELSPFCRRAVVSALLVAQCLLVAWEAYRDSPTWDEVAHVAAGYSHLKLGSFALYRVNPPLVRLVACIPLRFLMKADVDFSEYEFPPTAAERTEFAAGKIIAVQNGFGYFWLVTLARWMCIPFVILGGLICYTWARDLYGTACGIFALGLWTFDPNVIAYGHLITPDVGATSLGLSAAYAFWRWLGHRTWPRAILAGVVLGLAELTKSTWAVLFFLWPVLWLMESWPQRAVLWRGKQMAAIVLLALYVLNLGYLFEGSFTRLRDYHFVSGLLSGNYGAYSKSGNRWANSSIGAVRVPLPLMYVSGIDVQKHDFEIKSYSYLNGEWRFGGWWYYYIFAIAFKEPIGVLTLVAVASAAGFVRFTAARRADEVVLLAPAVCVFLLVSSQTGFNHHVRYVLPSLPFVFIWVSKLASRSADRRLVYVSLTCLAQAVLSSLLVFPHSLSYFSELAGGPKHGHLHLGNSNADWGQDLLYLKQWLEAHPSNAPVHLAYDMPLIDPRLAGIEYKRVPPGPSSGGLTDDPSLLGPQPGRYIVSVNRLQAPGGEYAYFEQFSPVDRIGYSMNVYDISLERANAARIKLGLPLVAENGG
jgi:4-amino-4-deoxy-L-arabinose transferase-like glycosyltransferase